MNGSNNDVVVLQRGNSNKQTSTITVDSGHTVDVFQRYGDHAATINLSNDDGGFIM